MILSEILTTVASGMWISVTADSGHSAWIGYQVLAGIGIGAGLTIPIMVTQAVVAEAEEVALATAIVICASSFYSSLPLASLKANM